MFLCCIIGLILTKKMKQTEKHWKYKEEIEISEDLIEACGSRIVAKLLAYRGILKPDEANSFLNISESQLSSPYEFENIETAIQRISVAIKNNEHIVIYGDFDVDGITSTSILLKTLRALGANVSYYIPDRATENHGLNTKAICKLISTRQTKLFITVDCGITNNKEIDLAINFGADVIITDHHELPNELPNAYAIINPKMLVPNSKMFTMCGAGVAYKLAIALTEHFKIDNNFNILYLAAIGTIADLVPLKHENRVIASLGLKEIILNQPLAIKTIAKNAGVSIEENFSSQNISFMIAPRLNAIGRLDNASIAVELLTSDDPETVEELVKNLESLNSKRQKIQEKTFEQACLMLKDTDLNKNKAIILLNKEWHPGVIGIVASKLIETFYRPTFLMTVQENEVKGSARGIDGLHLFNLLNKHNYLFTKFGGHEYAAGFSFPLNKLDEFKQKILNEVNEELKNTIPTPHIDIEIDIAPEDINNELVTKINMLAPFGQNNPSPKLSCSKLMLAGYKTIGSNNNHLKLLLKGDNDIALEALWWQTNSLDIPEGEVIRVAFTPEINNYMSKSKIQLIIEDIQPNNTLNNHISSYKNNIKWIDHRNKSNILKLLENYNRTSNAKIAIFAESQPFIELIKLDCPIVNRLTDNNSFDQIVLLEYPSDQVVLNYIVTVLKPKIIHLASQLNCKNYNEKEIMRFVFGMLKYAQVNKGAEANINHMAAKLGTSIKVISSTIDILINSERLQILKCTDNIIKFRLNDTDNIDNSKTYDLNNLKLEVDKVIKYKNSLTLLPISEFSFI